jgi:DNA-binding transcriptional ArsR family regulator
MNQALNHGLRALSDPTRLAILRSLAEAPHAVSDLAERFPVSRPAISQHLKVLKSAGLVSDRPLGTKRVYQIDARGIDVLKTHLDALWSAVLEGFANATGAPDTPPLREAKSDGSSKSARRRDPQDP